MENKENKIKAVKLSEDELENVSGGASEYENANESTDSELLKPVTTER